MKLLVKISIIIICLYSSLLVLNQNVLVGNLQNKDSINQKTSDLNQDSSAQIDEEDYFLDNQEIFPREAFQRRLPPLSKKKKIIWSFRLSEPHPFL